MSQAGNSSLSSRDQIAPSKKAKLDVDKSTNKIAQEVLKALSPILEAMENKIMANTNIAIKNFYESLLEQILQLNQTLAASSARITKLENQIAQVRNAQKAIPPP